MGQLGRRPARVAVSGAGRQGAGADGRPRRRHRRGYPERHPPGPRTSHHPQFQSRSRKHQTHRHHRQTPRLRKGRVTSLFPTQLSLT